MPDIILFKAFSRLGMKNLPYKGNTFNLGVEKGPEILGRSTEINIKQTHTFFFTNPEDINESSYFDLIAEESKKFSELININIKKRDLQLVLGGDHSVAFSSLLALQERFDLSEVGYIQFDSHADINLTSTSPTGNFHGMFLRPFLTEFDNDAINKLVKQRLPFENLIYIGNLDMDLEEKCLIAEKKVKQIDSKQLNQDLDRSTKDLVSFISQYRHIHVSFDIDVFDSRFVQATGTPGEPGLFLEQVFPLLEEIASNCRSISIDLVELNPLKEGYIQSKLIALNVLTTLIDNLNFTFIDSRQTPMNHAQRSRN